MPARTLTCPSAPRRQLVIFEINACVQVTGTIPDQYREGLAYVEANNDEIIHAVLERVRTRAAAGPPGGGAT